MNMALVDAVNICLRAVGESPVPTADSLNPYATAALDLIEEKSRSIQAKGWYFNTLQNLKLVPDADGFIFLPNNAMGVNTNDALGGFTIRGNKLFDTYEHTDVFKYPITLDVIEYLDFDLLPYSAANHIAYQAALEMQTTYETEQLKIQMYLQRAERASIEMKRDHYRNRNINAVRNKTLGNLSGSSRITSNANFIGGSNR